LCVPHGAPSHERLAFAALLELPELLSGPQRQRSQKVVLRSLGTGSWVDDKWTDVLE